MERLASRQLSHCVHTENLLQRGWSKRLGSQPEGSGIIEPLRRQVQGWSECGPVSTIKLPRSIMVAISSVIPRYETGTAWHCCRLRNGLSKAGIGDAKYRWICLVRRDSRLMSGSVGSGSYDYTSLQLLLLASLACKSPQDIRT